MKLHFVGQVPDRPILLVVVMGPRTDEAGAQSTGEIIALRASTGMDAILFDARNAEDAKTAPALMKRALAAGEALARSRIAIVCHDVEADYPRVWRRALCETGHEAQVFTTVAEAEAWLLSPPDGDLLFLA